MKLFNKLYLFIFVALAFACDPYEDTFQEIEENMTGPTAELELTLTEDDYALLEDIDGTENIVENSSFSSEEDVRTYIPMILDSKFPQLDNSSTANVTYDFYNPVSLSDEIVEYTVTEADYEAVGGSAAQFGNFDSPSQISGFLNSKYPDATDGETIELTYDFYNGSFTSEVTNYIYLFEGSWYVSYQLQSEDYDFMELNFSNFDDEDEAMTRISIWLEEEFKFQSFQEGDRKVIAYVFTYVDDEGDRFFEDRILMFEYSQNGWSVVPSVIEKSLQFGKEDNQWVPDNTISYTLTGGDYQAIASNEDLGTGPGRDNLAQFGNFNLGTWSLEEIYASIEFILKEKFPNSEVGQKYLVTYQAYSGATVDYQVKLILNAEGNYELVEEGN